MVMKVDPRGRVNNIHLSTSNGLLPLFEAVVNSIQAIEERQNTGENIHGEITVTIHRSDKQGQQELELGAKSLPPIIGFSIKDNGVGFNERNYNSFNTSDSTYKFERGCKGVGHLSWAKVFDITHIQSVFVHNGKHFHRDFDFTIDEVVEQKLGEEPYEVVDGEICTTVHLDGFKEEYRIDTKSYKRGLTIAKKILNHCLSYYITESAPSITVCDEDYLEDGEDKDSSISLNDIYSSEIKENTSQDEIRIGNYTFFLLHLKNYGAVDENHRISYCGNKRVVAEEQLTRVCGGKKQLSGDKGRFVYAVYVSSSYLDEAVNQSRTGFTIPHKSQINEDNVRNLAEGDPCMEEIKNEISNAAKNYLKDYLSRIQEDKIKLVEEYLSNINPALRFVYISCPDQILDEISLGMDYEKMSSVLYKYKGLAEHKALEETRTILSRSERDTADIRTEVEQTIQKIADVRKTGLAEYVLYRYKLLQLFQKRLELNRDGKYSPEGDIHDVIYPRKITSDTLGMKEHNLWILDDRLTFHSYAASDISIKKLIEKSESERRPDILIFKEGGNNGKASSVTVVEFKRPDRIDENILDQIFKYIRDLEENKIQTESGRTIYTSKETIFYCYAICDFKQYESKIMKMVDQGDFKELMGELGYYTYNSKHNAHVEVIAYDKLVSDAKMRNHVWFEKLGFDTNDI